MLAAIIRLGKSEFLFWVGQLSQ